MSDSSEAAVRRFYAAEAGYMTAANPTFAPVAATLDSKCIIYEPASLPYGGEWRGHAGFEQWLKLFKQTWLSLEVRDSRMFSQGNLVCSSSHVVATVRATGQTVEWDLLQLFTLRDGKVLELRPFHWDTAAILKSLASLSMQ